jgi:hypothetical protein
MDSGERASARLGQQMNDDRMQEIYQLQQHIRSLNTALPIDSITLRDFFAASAMQAFISNDNFLKAASSYSSDGSEASIAMLAYDQADAMIEARKK